MGSMSNEIMVSVQCITYNHGKYIRKALEGFVKQKTNFKFEVIVHDDASDDGTQDIIREYAEKYDFIFPILQKENQYSKKIPFTRKYIHPLLKGKYIAFCEGDDFWTDENKLQVLFDYMEAHKECSMCCHAYTNVVANTEEIVCEVHTLEEDGTITMEKAIKYDNPTQLASQMFRRDCILDKPDIFNNRGVGDYTILLYAAYKGEIHYIDKLMACHRVAADGSWSVRVLRNKELKVAHDRAMIAFLNDFDEYTQKRYSSSIIDKVEEYKLDISRVYNDFKGQCRNRKFEEFSLVRRMLVRLGCFFPKLVSAVIDKHDFGE